MIGLPPNHPDNRRMEYRINTVVNGDLQIGEWKTLNIGIAIIEIRHYVDKKQPFSVEFRSKT